MSTNDSEVRADEQNTGEEVEAEKAETVVPKPPIVETAEAKRARLMRQLHKVNQELGITEEDAEKERDSKGKPKPFSLGWAEKAYLNANGVRGKEEYDLVTDMVQNTGKDLESLLESKYFQAELRDLRATKESRAASDAASGSRKGGATARDSVDYWVSKGELPPAHMVQLRREVVNARLKSERDGSKFASRSVIGQ